MPSERGNLSRMLRKSEAAYLEASILSNFCIMTNNDDD